MTEFPQNLLVAKSAHCHPRSGPTQQAAITIALDTFLLEGQRVDTCFRLDGIALDLHEPRNHAERCYRFPANPQDGYIDGSVYLQHRHVPVDVTELSFGQPGERTLPMDLTGTLVFSAAGIDTWRDTPVTLAFALDLPPTPAQVDAAIASAITATRARSMSDAGRVMAWLVREHPHWDDRRTLNERARQILSSTPHASR